MAKEAAKKVKTPTAQKRNIQNSKKRLQNKSFKSKMKTAITAFKASLVNDEAAVSKENLNTVFSLLDKCSKKKVFKKNKSNRIKSKLNLLFQGKKS